MSSNKDDQPIYIHANAKALEGYLKGEVQKTIPTIAPTVLPTRGGLVTNRVAAFNLEEVVSFSSAYTRVSGCTHPGDEPSVLVMAAVIEGLNILEILKADRVVSQLTIALSKGQEPSYSFTGSRIEGLYVAGKDGTATLNMDGREWQAKRKQAPGAGTQPATSAAVLSSLVDGNQVEVPGFGRFFFGEVLQTSSSLQLTGIRAELGSGSGSGCCSIVGQMLMCCTGGGGGHS
jgi:hypothetical protein